MTINETLCPKCAKCLTPEERGHTMCRKCAERDMRACEGGSVRLTPTQQAVLSLLARCRCDGAPYPSCAVLARELRVEISAVSVTLRRLERLGALTLAPAGRGRDGRSYAQRLTLLWDDERIALGGVEQRTLWSEA